MVPLSTILWLLGQLGSSLLKSLAPGSSAGWPAKSPDLSPLDFWFWGVAMEEGAVQPNTLEELKKVVEDFADAMNSDTTKGGGQSWFALL